MAESITISPLPPAEKSMQYQLLRAEGLRHIQEMAANLWTDYNISDPGVTILEVLSYVINDIGYRISYSIPDILAQNPNLTQADIKNFFTARQILPMRPVTYNDYRKLMMDVEVVDLNDTDCPRAGVKNAWIERAPDNEIPVYLDRLTDSLSYSPVDPSQPERVDIRPLYDVLLEFDRCETLGDLNENTMEKRIKLYPCAPSMPFPPIPAKLIGVSVKVGAEFPRWDDKEVDWTDNASIKKQVKNLVLDFSGLGSGYKVEGYGFYPDHSVWITITHNNIAVDTQCIVSQINSVLFTGADNLLAAYQKKVKKVMQIVDQVRARLMDNRNLCEDFYRISALRIEQIAICADIQISPIADVDQVLAEMYFRIGNFLAPTVNFYSLDEMTAKGYGTEEIFEGPALDHGFIDTKDLKKADRKKSIHVSDLIQIIMDIPGVEAVKSIQIANIPLDNEFNIPSVSVKWCLQLAFDKNYVPRLTTERSSITFFKDVLPYQADEERVDVLLEALQDAQRTQKLYNTPLDIPVPEGTYRDIGNYVSIQDEFPLNYGIGPEGLPLNSSDLRIAQARQLKGFLMFFDQLLADYFSQLEHVRDLFSMNAETNAGGDFVIDKSYFTQSLVPYVTDANLLLTDPAEYPQDLQAITEDKTLFESRRSRFLDHLMARFCEQFTDYAMLMYRMDGPKASNELLVDKLRLLNEYPVISSDRFKAFNYESPCKLWHIDNTSGLEKRISLLTGIDERKASTLNFGNNIKILPSGTQYKYVLVQPPLIPYFESVELFDTIDEAKLGAEKFIINGVNDENYLVLDFNKKVVNDPLGSYILPFKVYICCGEKPLAVNNLVLPDYTTAMVARDGLRNTAMPFLENEYYNNPESNRNNLACGLERYYSWDPVTVDLFPEPPTYSFDFRLYQFPGGPMGNTELLYGTYTGYGNCKSEEKIISVTPGTYEIVMDGNFAMYFQPGDPVSITGSQDNDGDYTVLMVSPVAILPGVFQTIVQFDGTPTLTTSTPLGRLQFNKQTAAELTQIGEDNVHQVLFDLSETGLKPAHYTFTDFALDPLNYRFHIVNNCGDILASSTEKNFNDELAATVLFHQGPWPNNTIEVLESTNNNLQYTVNNAVAEGAEIRIEVAESVASTIADGIVRFVESQINILAVDPERHVFKVAGNYARRIFPGQIISLSGYAPNDGNYTIDNIYYDGALTEIVVVEKIDSGVPSGTLSYIKTLEITRIELNTLADDAIYVKGGADDYAVKQMMDFIRTKFFSHEGIHLVEHLLLRPKHNGKFDIDFSDGGKELETGLSPLGNMTFMKKLPVFSVDLVNNMFFVAGDITSELAAFDDIIIKASTAQIYDGKYKALTVGFNGTETGIKVFPNIPNAVLPGPGEINYKCTLAITSNTNTDVVLPVNDFEVAPQYPVTISGSQNAVNDGEFTIELVSGSPSATFTLKGRETLIQDDLMQVNLWADCETCTYTDPYSFVATAIMPAWQGRFSNFDYRSFFDRALRLECPAHLVLNICWINCEQMMLFEKAYKKWLIENSRKNKRPKALSDALNALIAIMSQLRSSFPQGTLHDCEIDDTLNNAIILNRTIIGTT